MYDIATFLLSQLIALKKNTYFFMQWTKPVLWFCTQETQETMFLCGVSWDGCGNFNTTNKNII